MKEKITDKKALALKPKNLSKMIEPELQVPPPRPVVWAAREWSHRKIVPEIEYLLIHGQAARAWVTRDKSGWESGPEAGPYYNIQYCFETEHSLIHGKYGASFDGLHLAYGSPDFSAWISRAFKKGGTF
ncbi:hypothetical protein KAS33_00435, partial [bacterium]|nr:hypothetical protein [bacterium]